MALLTALAVALPVTAAALAPAAVAAPVETAAVRTVPAAAPAGTSVAPLAAACPGRRIVHKPIKLNGYKIGWLNVYYSRSKGTKCGVVMHTGASWGKSAYTKVELWTRNASAVAAGDYRYRTGRALIGGVRGVCVSAQGLMDWRGKTRTATVHGLCG